MPMDLLQQKEIRSLIKEAGVSVSAPQLKDYLIKNHHRIEGLRIRHRENLEKTGLNKHWYDILSSIPQTRANKLVAQQYLRDREEK